MTNYDKAKTISESINDGYDVYVVKNGVEIKLVAATYRKERCCGIYVDQNNSLQGFDASELPFKRVKTECFFVDEDVVQRDETTRNAAFLSSVVK